MPYTPEVITALRRLIADTTTPYDFTDLSLDAYLTAHTGDLKLTAATIWREKAAGYAELVDITEAGSSRKNSDLYKRAKELAAELDPPTDPTVVGQGTRIRAITRS